MDALLNSRKHLYAMAVGLCLAVLVGGWFLLISPKRAQVADLRAKVDAQESTNSSLRSQIAALQALQAKLPQQQAALAQMQSKVPNKSDLPGLLRMLNKAASDSGVLLVGIVPSAAAPVTGANGVSGIDVTLKASGDYVSLEQYQLALEGLSRAFLVNGMSISESTTTAAAPGAATASSGGTSLTATINGRVLLQTSPAAPVPSSATTTG
jgi:Tfp pilus assembly protein PilO